MKEFYAYIYRMPITNIPFYVGKGCDGRSSVHLRRKDDSYMARKVRKLLKMGTPPSVEVIGAIDESHALFLEECLIQVFGRRDLGKGPLLNLTDGGGGISNVSPEVRARMSASHTGVKKGPHSETGKANISLVQRTSPAVKAARAHHSKIMTGRSVPVEIRAKMSNSHKGKKFSETHLANIKKSAQIRGAKQRALKEIK